VNYSHQFVLPFAFAFFSSFLRAAAKFARRYVSLADLAILAIQNHD